MEIKYHGHSTVSLIEGDTKILIDPFLKPNNPAAEKTADEVDATHILITHGHADHFADAVAVAKRCNAECAAVTELANVLDENGIETTYDLNAGGTIRWDWGWAKLVQAVHTSTLPGSDERPYSPTTGTVIGLANGWVVNIGGKTVYHLGDTALFSDLKLITERTPADVALIPIGGHYTMDRHDAVVAADFVGAGTVIPVHYDTFPPIETDAEAFKADVEKETSSKVVVLKPEESTEV